MKTLLTKSALAISILATVAEAQTARIYAGGVSGCGDLAVSGNSTDYRAAGGGVFIHSVGWQNHTTTREKNRIQNLWDNREWGIEMGFTEDNYTSRQNAYDRRYLSRGIEADYITINAYSSGRVLDPNQWEREREAYYDLGVPRSTAIYATFEYQNHPNFWTNLQNNLVSDRADFQRVIRESGGMVLDTPPAVYFRRLASSNTRIRRYRDWIVDAVQWAKSEGHTVGIIVSPNSSGTGYEEDTERFIDDLRDMNALPDFFISENYSTEDPSTYANEVGNEDTPHHQLGCARLIQTEFFPASTSDLDATYRAGDFNGESHPNDNRRVRRGGGGTVSFVRSNTWIRFDDFNFSSNPASIDIEATSPNRGGSVEIRVNSPSGRRLGTVDIGRTGDYGTYRTFSASLADITGSRDLYFVFNAPNGGFNLRDFVVNSTSLPPASIGRVYNWNGNQTEPINRNQIALRGISNSRINLNIPRGSRDPYIRFRNANVNGNLYTHVRFRVINRTDGTKWRLFFNAGNGEGGNSLPVEVAINDSFRTYTVDMRADPDWDGNIESVRIDMEPNKSGPVTFGYVSVITAP